MKGIKGASLAELNDLKYKATKDGKNGEISIDDYKEVKADKTGKLKMLELKEVAELGGRSSLYIDKAKNPSKGWTVKDYLGELRENKKYREQAEKEAKEDGPKGKKNTISAAEIDQNALDTAAKLGGKLSSGSVSKPGDNICDSKLANNPPSSRDTAAKPIDRTPGGLA